MAEDLTSTLATIPGLRTYLGAGDYMRARDERQKLSDILAQGGDPEQVMRSLSMAGPTGVALAERLGAVAKEQAALADSRRQAAMRSPGFVSKFMTPGSPAIQPDPQEAEQSADYGTPPVATVPAKPAGFDAQGYLNAAAASGGVDPLALAKERIAENQPKFAPSRSPGYMVGGRFIETPVSDQPRNVQVQTFPISATHEQPHQFDARTGTWVPVPGTQPRPIFNPATGPGGVPKGLPEQLYKDYANQPQVKEANDLEQKIAPLTDYMIDFKKTGRSVNANDAALAKAYLAVTTSLGNRAYNMDKRELAAMPNIGDRIGNMASSFFAGKDLTDQSRTEMFNYIVSRYRNLDSARQNHKALTVRRGSARGVTAEQIFGAEPD